ncbi:unnamed protein product [Spirodela intermedia]|uniref:Uncharacterized protein n=1 Tax=Spirodela intermedia TaxID=51605 RepID=A0A7I8JB18_SPIIN|nr:unnamed protein product [Spirodela intermedia]CAA6666672.1 unnamed protein product [Spirodela intermedia]
MILGGGAVSAYVAPLQPQSSARPHRASSAAAVVASAKRLRRWRRPSPEEDDAGEYPEGTPEAGGGVLEFLTNLDSEAPPPPPTPAVSAGGSSLRGADVLQALQRRAAAAERGRRPVVEGGRKCRGASPPEGAAAEETGREKPATTATFGRWRSRATGPLAWTSSIASSRSSRHSSSANRGTQNLK